MGNQRSGRKPVGAPKCRDAVLAALEALDGQKVTRRELAACAKYSIYTVSEIVRQLADEGNQLADRVIDNRPKAFRITRDGFPLPDPDEIVRAALRSRTDLDVLWF